jgi:hypothetical protein
MRGSFSATSAIADERAIPCMSLRYLRGAVWGQRVRSAKVDRLPVGDGRIAVSPVVHCTNPCTTDERSGYDLVARRRLSAGLAAAAPPGIRSAARNHSDEVEVSVGG